jgi:hypothetical protein
LEYQKTLGDTTPEIKKIDVTDPISAIWLEFQGTNGSTSNKGNFISDVITKIEVVDGSDVLVSMRMDEAEALQFYKTGKTPAIFPSEWGGGSQRHGVYILFGRHLWDLEYALNPARFKNLQLKVTPNIAAVTAAHATTAFVSGSLKYSAVLKLMEDVTIPGKFLMQKQIESWTGAASGEKRVDLPIDYPYRMLMMRLFLQNYDINELCTDLKLTCDTDKYIQFNRKVAELDAEALARFGMVTFKHDICRSNADHTRLLVNKEPLIQPYLAIADVQNFINLNNIWSNDMYAFQYDKNGAADTSDRNMTMMESGHALHATLPIPFGRMQDASDLFDAPKYKKVELVLSQGGAASGVGSVVVEQVRSN